MKNEEPQEQHRWLQRLLGEWTYEGEAPTGPGKPVEKWNGTESVRSAGDFWVLCEGRGEMPGGGMATMLMTLGYDSRRKAYVGTWIGSMMSHLWVYDGTLDEATDTLSLASEGPGMTEDGKMTKYKDVIQLRGDDHRVLTSQMLGDDGQWTQFMTVHYRRKK